MNPVRKTLLKLVFAGAAAIALMLILAVIAWTLYPRQIIVSAPFAAGQLSINTLDYYDVGTVDVNRDGLLDLYTTNHSSRQSLLVADGSGGYRERLNALALQQDRNFPGLEDTGKPPEMAAPGLYLYFVGSTLHFEHVTGASTSTYAGTLVVPGQPGVYATGGFSIETARSGVNDEYAEIRFATGSKGALRLDVTKSAPLKVSMDPQSAIDSVFVGADNVKPSGHDFELFLKDRHGIAWADVNGDGNMDAYMSRGALFGTLADLPGDFADQLYLSDTNGRLTDQFSELGMEKRDCPARQVAWTDANDDGLLDIYIACGRQVGGFWEYIPVALRRSRDEAPNLLFVQTESGRFVEIAAEFGLDFTVGGTFLWLDVDQDADQDLLWASETEISLYRQDSGRYQAEILDEESTTTQARQFASADFDRDGDIDIYIAASYGSKLIINESGNLRIAEPDDYGLPSRVRTAAWVDYDSDGYADFYAWPQGLYRQDRSGTFEATGLLEMPSPYWMLVDPRVVWFDQDNDGDRDMLLMQRFFPQVIQSMFPDAMPFSAELVINQSTIVPNQLSLDLTGDSHNPEAIGALVLATTSSAVVAHAVGQSESSHYSQGHYRIYVTVPRDELLHKADILWPDGSKQPLSLPPAGRHLRIEKPGDVNGHR